MRRQMSQEPREEGQDILTIIYVSLRENASLVIYFLSLFKRLDVCHAFWFLVRGFFLVSSVGLYPQTLGILEIKCYKKIYRGRERVCLLLVCRSSTIAFCVPFIHLSFIHLTNTKFIEYLFMLGTGDTKMTKRRNSAFKLFIIWSRPAHNLDSFHLLNHRLPGLEGTY